MSNVGLPPEIVDAMYERAISHPSRGRKKNGEATSRSVSGLTGAYQKGGYGKWYSRITINGKTVRLKNSEGKSYFHSAEEAHKAYMKAATDAGILATA